MSTWLKMTNIIWFRQMLADEPNEAKRRDLEQKLAEAEADVHSVIFTDLTLA